MKKKVLKTQAVYESQSGPVVAEQIDEVLAEFGVRQKVVAITVDNAPIWMWLLEQITDEDFRRAEDFISLMRMLYTSTLCVSSDKSSTCGQIIPILQKLKTHLTIKEEDSTFVATVKEKFWGDLSKRYQDHDIMAFLEEATLMDPRFKGKLSTDEVWERLKAAALREMLGEEDAVPVEAQERHVVKKPRVSALEEFFAEDDKELRRSLIQKQKTAPTILENIRNELSVYRGLLPIPTSEDPAHWWW
ncbi:hypothetical protein F7725_014603, partial [Dissostichus mawsoni]